MASSKVGELRYKTCFDHFACRASGQDTGKWRIVEEIRIRIGRAGHYKERPAVLDRPWACAMREANKRTPAACT